MNHLAVVGSNLAVAIEILVKKVTLLRSDSFLVAYISECVTMFCEHVVGKLKIFISLNDAVVAKHEQSADSVAFPCDGCRTGAAGSIFSFEFVDVVLHVAAVEGCAVVNISDAVVPVEGQFDTTVRNLGCIDIGDLGSTVNSGSGEVHKDVVGLLVEPVDVTK